MEHAKPFNLVRHGYADASKSYRWDERLDDLKELCLSYDPDSDLAEGCWRGINQVIMESKHYDVEKIFDYCNQAQGERERFACKTYAFDSVLNRLSYNWEGLKRFCERPEDELFFRKTCYSIIAGSLIGAPPVYNIQGAVSFCNSLDSDFGEACFENIGKSLRYMRFNSFYDKIRIRHHCLKAPVEYQQKCRGEITKTNTSQKI